MKPEAIGQPAASPDSSKYEKRQGLACRFSIIHQVQRDDVYNLHELCSPTQPYFINCSLPTIPILVTP
ncbi:hypothetical protein, partial [Undibacterium curvum]|uniref:hypothetical protein n=1 Tax=Undibacterium curvum TaxID=2762294 RepID=UPI003BF607A3